MFADKEGRRMLGQGIRRASSRSRVTSLGRRFSWRCVLVVGVAGMVLIGCSQNKKAEEPSMGPAVMRNPNQQILDEVNASNVWFHAKKVHAIWAKEVEQEQTVQTLEGDEQVRPGDFLCRGAGGEVWPQRAESLQSKYDATEEIDENGWRKYTPRPDNKGVFAAHVDHLFAVQASWGTLRGKPGDYLLKGFDDKDVEYPQDVWIVDKDLFAATYEKVEP